jgi:hypothetical protein
MKIYPTLILMLITFSSYAQFSITGKVLNKADNKPIANAVAFLNKTGIANNTNTNGDFALNNISGGQYLLTVTIVGYSRYTLPVTLTADMHLPDIELSPKTDTLAEVAIKGKAHVSPYYYTFRNDFLGSTLFARQCKIINPWVIHFSNTDTIGNYTAKSNGFIDIENDALGYRIKLLLNFFTKQDKTNNPDHTNRTDYDGESYFEEMKGTPQQEHEWQKNRMECYQGSQMQFLRAVLSGNAKQQGFLIKKAYLKKNPYYNPMGIYDDPMNDEYLYKIKDTVLKEQDILRKTDKHGLFAIARVDSNPNSCLYVEYLGAKTNKHQARIPWIWGITESYILFDKPYAVFDYHGVINTHGNITFTGFLGKARIANQLPEDFEPGQ